ncbi:MAG TPA: hypothetical protein PLB01_00135 [Thermoanaerobaculia bacterium]|nr:hypothetical protein [Thermoanaerobaculia bacterium]
MVAVLLAVWFGWLAPSRRNAAVAPAPRVEATYENTCKIEKFDDEAGPKWKCYQDGVKVPCPRALPKLRNCNATEDVIR